MGKRILQAVLAMVVFLGLAAPALADGIIIPRPRPDDPVPPLRSLAIKHHRVTVTIKDQVATTHVDQVFVNESNQEIEGEYIFPLPEEASISQFAMWVDGKRLEAEVLDREKAREIYEDIVRRQRDPALLEYAGRNAFRARIYPIPARGEKRVELEYTEVLPLESGLLRYVYPLNTEKFSTRPLEQVSVSVHVSLRQALKAVYSPSHEVVVHRHDDGTVDASYEEMGVTPERDFVLYCTVSEEDLGANLVSYKEGKEDGFFLLMLAPKAKVGAQRIVAKDVFFVLDTSGSMRGKKLTQAKRAAQYVLDNLNEGDRFNVIAFSSSTSQYASGPRSVKEVEEARAFIERLESAGGTNIHAALEETFAQAGSGRPQVVIFLTDGLATEGEIRTEKIIEMVAARAGKDARIFTFGVGYEVNTMLLDTVSQGHHGTSSYVRPDEDLEQAISSFCEKISTPVLADLSLDFGGARVEDTYPHPLPDLFAGGQIILVGRYRQGGNATITLRGTVNGEPATYTFRDVRFRSSGGDDFIPRLWATRKIGHLLTQIRLHGAERELVDEVVGLSVRYGIVTPYTSFLVDETEDALTAGGRRSIAERELGKSAPGGAAPAPTAAASGAAAVNKSVAQESLRSADLPAEPGTSQVRAVGEKAFVLRDGVWIDTLYDAKTMRTEQVAFGSERYFELVRAHPQWGRYLALGDQVILVWQGKAYQIGATGEAGPKGEPTSAQPTREPTKEPSHGTPTPAAPESPWQRVLNWWKGLLG
jgi:Ca-activated chloride channel family protein